jgi:hypothetical protein
MLAAWSPSAPFSDQPDVTATALERELTMSMKDAYQQKLKARLEEWRAEMDKMRAKAEQAEADAKIEYEAQLRELEERRQEAEAKLEELRQSGDAAWEDMKYGLESAWDSLEQAMRRARERFQ